MFKNEWILNQPCKYKGSHHRHLFRRRCHDRKGFIFVVALPPQTNPLPVHSQTGSPILILQGDLFYIGQSPDGLEYHPVAVSVHVYILYIYSVGVVDSYPFNLTQYSMWADQCLRNWTTREQAHRWAAAVIFHRAKEMYSEEIFTLHANG